MLESLVPSLEVMLHPLDVITLRVEVDAWEAGTLATVLEVTEETVLAEVSDESGRSLDIITVPANAAERVEAESVPKRPEASQSVPRRPAA